jgi:hypothetical protein
LRLSRGLGSNPTSEVNWLLRLANFAARVIDP